MRSAMQMASDEEVISAIKQLESINALEQVHLKPLDQYSERNQLLL
jgi:hypothetical protein